MSAPGGSDPDQSAAVSLRSAFQLLADDTGDITPLTLRRVSHDMGFDYTEDEIWEMIQEADSAGDGKVSLKSLVHMIREYSEDFPNLSSEEIQREATSVSRGLTTIKDKGEFEELGIDEEKDNLKKIDNDNVGDNSECSDTDEYPGKETGRRNIGPKRDTQDRCPTPGLHEEARASHSRASHVVTHSLDDGVVTLIKMYEEEEKHNSNIQDGEKSNDNNGRVNDKRVPKSLSIVLESEDTHSCSTRTFGNVEEFGSVGDGYSEADSDRTEPRRKQLTSVNKGSKARKTSLTRRKSNVDKRTSTIMAEKDVGETYGAETLNEQEPTNVSRTRNINTTNRERSNIKATVRERTNISPTKRENANISPTKRERTYISPMKRHSTHISPSRQDRSQNSPTKPQDSRYFSRHRNRDVPSEESPRGSVMSKRESPNKGQNYKSRMGIALKLSQLRMKQRLLYIMWRALYEKALKKAESNRKAMLFAKEKKKKPLRRKRSKSVDK